MYVLMNVNIIYKPLNQTFKNHFQLNIKLNISNEVKFAKLCFNPSCK